ncbi:MAG TPA: CvpA family protein [Gammaproteobacteria bacterium]|nr:CvpA family protein [Gammaproteobacteria bacterium]
MTAVDYVIIAVCVFSAGVGFWRGFTKEALSLLTLLAAIWLAWRFAWVIEPYLGDWAGPPNAKVWAARVVVFVLVLAVGALASWLARTLIRHTGLSGLDRLLGGVFGLVRGALIVGLAVIALEFTGLDQDPRWQQAALKTCGDRVARGIRYYAELGSRYLQEQELVQSV